MMYMGVSSYNRARTQTSQWEEPGVTLLAFKSLAAAVTDTFGRQCKMLGIWTRESVKALSRTYRPDLVESWKTVLRIR